MFHTFYDKKDEKSGFLPWKCPLCKADESQKTRSLKNKLIFTHFMFSLSDFRENQGGLREEKGRFDLKTPLDNLLYFNSLSKNKGGKGGFRVKTSKKKFFYRLFRPKPPFSPLFSHKLL